MKPTYVVLAILAGDCQAAPCPADHEAALTGDDGALQLLQRRARSLPQNSSHETWATRGLESLAMLDAGDVWRGQWAHQAAAPLLGAWVACFCGYLSFLMYSALSPRDVACDDRLSVCKGEKVDGLEKAFSVNPLYCFSFTFLDSLRDKGASFFATPCTAAAVSVWEVLRRSVGRPLALLLCAWCVAFLELVAMVLILNGLLMMCERRAILNPLQITSVVLLLLFLIPLVYRYFTGVLLVLDGLQVATVSTDLASLIYQKALRLPIGSSYHAEPNGWQAAKVLIEGLMVELPSMFRSLALCSAVPLAVAALVGLMLMHLGPAGLWGLLLLLPGCLVAGLLVRLAISQRNRYQTWHAERLRLRSVIGAREKMLRAKTEELWASRCYSLLTGLLVATIQSVVWLLVVASLTFSGQGGRSVWLTLQMMTSLQGCCGLLVSGLRRGLSLPTSLKRVDCFLKQPEMPADVVRLPLSTAPVARISGSFSFEEGGAVVLELDLAIAAGEKVALVGPRESGKSAVLLALLGELFPCGLACVAAASRCYVSGTKLPEALDANILLWDDANEESFAILKSFPGAVLCCLRAPPAEGFDRVVTLSQGRAVRDAEEALPEVEPTAQRTQSEPLGLLGEALLRAQRATVALDLGDATGPGHDFWNLLLSHLRAAPCSACCTLVLVVLQRCLQLLQLLLLAAWGDEGTSYAKSLLVVVAMNAAFFALSEWMGSCVLSHTNLGRADDGVLLSSWLTCIRTLVGSLLQQLYVMSIAPQWLAFTILLPVYLCVGSFIWIHLQNALRWAIRGEASVKLLRELLESLDDVVSLRGNRLQRRSSERFAACVHALTGYKAVLPAAGKSWLCFRVTLCMGFACAACALQVLLCDDRQMGVGTLGLVISVLFALATDVEVLCDCAVQGCVALTALETQGPSSDWEHAPEDLGEEPAWDVDRQLLRVAGESIHLQPGMVAVILDPADVRTRSCGFYVSQDPKTWDGTWREHLDPGDRFADDRLWHALRGSGLADLVQDLASAVPNLSLPQRQLLGVARAWLGGVVLAEVLEPEAMKALEFVSRDVAVAVAVCSEASATALGLEVAK